jgi:hypothetical protein
VTRRIGARWIAGVVLPLVLGGLILMHTVDLAPAEATSPSEHAAVDGGAVEMRGGHDHGCDGCHLGLHMTAVCVAVLGSIAVWRLARHIADDTSTMDTSVSGTVGRPAPPPLLRSGRPPWVALGVMRC